MPKGRVFRLADEDLERIDRYRFRNMREGVALTRTGVLRMLIRKRLRTYRTSRCKTCKKPTPTRELIEQLGQCAACNIAEWIVDMDAQAPQGD